MTTLSSDATTMRAVRLHGPTEVGALVCEPTARPRAGAGEVLVEVHASAVNRSDVLNVRGLLPIATFPRIPGRDFAGIVVEGPADLVGREVWGSGGGDLGFTRDGAHAQYLTLPSDCVTVKPSVWTMEEAGSAGLTLATAALALSRAGEIAPGCTALITGAVGGVGGAASSLARLRGARVIGVVRGDQERRLAEQNGIDVIVDSERDDIAKSVAEATAGIGAHIAVDTVGVPLFDEVVDAMAFEGGVCLITAPGPSPAGFDTLSFYRRELHLTGLNTTRLTMDVIADTLRSLARDIEQAHIRAPRIAAAYSLNDVVHAYSAVAEGQQAGRVLLRPNA